jgi:hypothetical protein
MQPSWSPVVRGGAAAWFLLGVLLLPGCSFPYCVYPTLRRVPPAYVGDDHETVRAFRAEITKKGADASLWDGAETVLLHPVPLADGSRVPAQSQWAWTSGVVALDTPVSGNVKRTSHEVEVRVYRPGYDLVRLTPWEWTEQVEWTAAPDLVTQEMALDGLFGLAGRGEKRGDKLEAGSADEEHRQALLFGAAEYERLSRPAGDPNADLPGVRARCLEKANKLRALAAQ